MGIGYDLTCRQHLYLISPLFQDVAGRKIWTDTFNGPIKCITSDHLGKTHAIAHGGDVTLLDQTTICGSGCGRCLLANVVTHCLATWENLRNLPNPPEFSRSLPPSSVRATHFTRGDQIITCYLDHGIVWVSRTLLGFSLIGPVGVGTWLRWGFYGVSGREHAICVCL